MTNPTMSASDELSERMAALLGSTPWEKQPSVIAEQIRQAEQAALKRGHDAGHANGWRDGRVYERRKTLEEAAQLVERTPLRSPVAKQRDKIAAGLRALAKSSEPGEAA